MTYFYSLQMKDSKLANNNDTSLLQNINPASEGYLTQLYDDVYKFTETNGNENIIFIENTDEIFMFRLENNNDSAKICMFLPLKKVSFDVESALNKTWRASKGNGGGYIYIHFDNTNNDPVLETLNMLESFSFTLENAALNFSDVTLNNDNTITATMNIDTVFFMTNTMLEELGIAGETVPLSGSVQVTINDSSNFLQFVDDGTIYKISFISDNEVFLSIRVGQEGEGEGEFVIRFSAN